MAEKFQTYREWKEEQQRSGEEPASTGQFETYAQWRERQQTPEERARYYLASGMDDFRKDFKTYASYGIVKDTANRQWAQNIRQQRDYFSKYASHFSQEELTAFNEELDLYESIVNQRAEYAKLQPQLQEYQANQAAYQNYSAQREELYGEEGLRADTQLYKNPTAMTALAHNGDQKAQELVRKRYASLGKLYGDEALGYQQAVETQRETSRQLRKLDGQIEALDANIESAEYYLNDGKTMYAEGGREEELRQVAAWKQERDALVKRRDTIAAENEAAKKTVEGGTPLSNTYAAYAGSEQAYKKAQSDYNSANSATENVIHNIMNLFYGTAEYDEYVAAKEKDEAEAAREHRAPTYDNLIDLFRSSDYTDTAVEGMLAELPAAFAQRDTAWKALLEKEALLRVQAQKNNDAWEYEMYRAMGDENFAKLSTPDEKKKPDGELGEIYQGLIAGKKQHYDDFTFTVREKIDGKIKEKTLEGNELANISDSEKALFFYYCNNGEYEKARLLIYSLADALRYRTGEAYAENVDYPVLRELAALAWGMKKGIEGLEYGIGSLLMPLDAPDVSSEEYAGAALYEKHKGTLAGFAIGASENIGNMVPSIAGYAINPTVGLSATFFNARGNAYVEAKRNGYSEGQAWVYSTLVGASEAGLEKLLGGLGGMAKGWVPEKLSAMMPKIKGIGGKLIKGLTLNELSEITEENLQNFLEPAFKMLVGAEREYHAPGYDDFIETTLVTAITTLAFAAVQAPGQVQQEKFNRQIGKFADAAMRAEQGSAVYQEGAKLREMLDNGESISAEYMQGIYNRIGKEGFSQVSARVNMEEAVEQAEGRIGDIDQEFFMPENAATDIYDTIDAYKEAANTAIQEKNSSGLLVTTANALKMLDAAQTNLESAVEQNLLGNGAYSDLSQIVEDARSRAQEILDLYMNQKNSVRTEGSSTEMQPVKEQKEADNVGMQAYLDAGASESEAFSAGEILDGILRGEITSNNITNQQIMELMAETGFGREAIAQTLGVEVTEEKTTSAMRRAVKRAIAQYENNMAKQDAAGEQQEATAQPDTTEGGNENAAEGTQSVRRDGGRNDGVDPGEQDGSVGESGSQRTAQRRAEGNGQQNNEKALRRQRQKERIKRYESLTNTTDAQKVFNSTKYEGDIAVVLEELYTKKMKDAAREVEDELGVKVIYFKGTLIREDASRRMRRTAGFFDRARNEIWATVGSELFEPEQLVYHEKYHAYVALKQADVKKTIKAIREQFNVDELEAMVQRYVRAYAGVYDNESIEDIYEELLADAYAGMNRFGDTPNATQYQQDVKENVKRGTRENERATRDTRGAPEQRFFIEDQNKRLSKDDVEEYLTVGDRQHVRNAKQKIIDSGGSPILTSEEEIRDYIIKSINGEERDSIKAYGRVGNGMAEEVKELAPDLDISDFYLELDANHLAHLSDHIENDTDIRNIPLTEEQVQKIPEYLDSYDDVLEVTRKKDGSIRIVFGKKINGHSVIVETVSKGRKSIHTRTAWQNTTEEYMRKYKKVDASATQNRASAKSGQDTGASTDTLTEKGEVVKQKFSFDDEDYMLAVEAGDMDAAQEMVDEAAQKTGYTIRAYHGTTQEFNVFDGGAFFTDDFYNADGYANGERVIDAFLKIKNPLVIDANGAKWDNLSTKYGESTREIVANADNGEFDGVIFEDIADSWIDDEEGGTCTVYYPFKNDQIKSADPVTYDDNGKLIPISARFDTGNKDIRYSIDEAYEESIDDWDAEGRPKGETFVLGSTGDTLQGLGAIESDIYLQGDKIKKILDDHPEMTLEEIKKIPQILEDPVLILKSRNAGRESRANTRLVIFGSVKAQNGKPVLSVLDLRPTEQNLVIDDMQKVNSAYTKKNDLELVQSSEVLHADKKRTIPLLRSMGLQLRPTDLLQYGSVGSITYESDKVNLYGEKFSDVIKVEGEGRFSLEDYGKEWYQKDAGEEAAELDEEYRAMAQEEQESDEPKLRNEDGSERKDWQIIQDEADYQAKMKGYPVIDGVQIVPNKTWVRVDETDSKGNKVRKNYGIVIGKGIRNNSLQVAFWNKHKDLRAVALISTEDIHPVQGQYQLTEEEYDSLMESVPEEVAAENYDYYDELEDTLREKSELEAAREQEEEEAFQKNRLEEHVQEMREETERNAERIQREKERLDNLPTVSLKTTVTGYDGEEITVEHEYGRKKPFYGKNTTLMPKEAIGYLEAATGMKWQAVPMKKGLWKAEMTTEELDTVFAPKGYSKYVVEMKERGEKPGNAKKYAQEMLAKAWRDPNAPSAATVHPEGVRKADFSASPALEKIGVKIDGSVVDYETTQQIRQAEDARFNIQKLIKSTIRRYGATNKEKAHAKSIAEGVDSYFDVPESCRFHVVSELAGLYMDERMAGNNLVSQRRVAIKTALLEKAIEMFPKDKQIQENPDLFHPTKLLTMNYRTPERNMYKIFGDELGGQIYDYYFAPVQANEAERTRWMQKQFDEVRKFRGEDGKLKKLNKAESAYTHELLDLQSYAEKVEASEKKDDILKAAEKLRRLQGEGKVNKNTRWDLAVEFDLDRAQSEWMMKYAQWLTMKEGKPESVDETRCMEAAKKYRELFDDYFDAINDFLVSHGGNPIGKIEGYAPHISLNEKVNLLNQTLEKLGFNDNATKLPAEIAGLTEEFRPDKRWTPFFQKRNGSKTDYDIVEGFERYVTYISDVLYHMDDIQKLRAAESYLRMGISGSFDTSIEEAIEESRMPDINDRIDYLIDMGRIEVKERGDYTEKEVTEAFSEFIDSLIKEQKTNTRYSDLADWMMNYTNILAGKQFGGDRGIEHMGGRGLLTLGNRINAVFARANVAGNLSSALKQMAQLSAILSKRRVSSVARAIGEFTTGRLREFAMESDYITAKKGVKYVARSVGDMFIEGVFKPVEFVDSMMSTLAVRSAYLDGIKNGMTETEAMRFADNFGRKIMADRSKGSKPNAFHSKGFVRQMLHAFQLESLNSWENIAQDLPRDFRQIARDGGKAKAARALALTLLKYLIAAFVLNRWSEEVYGGTPAPFDLFGMTANFIASGNGLTANEWIKRTINKVTGVDIFEESNYEAFDEFDWGAAAEDTVYNLTNEIPFVSNLSGMLGIGDKTLPTALPGIVHAVTGIYDAASENGVFSDDTALALVELLKSSVPGGRQIGKTVGGIRAAIEGGKMNGTGENERLQYVTDDSVLGIIQQVLFGVNATEESRAHYASGESGLTARQTQMWKEITEQGGDGTELFELIQGHRRIGNDDTLTSAERSEQQRNDIAGSSFTDEQKAYIYSVLFGDKDGTAQDEPFEELMDAGMRWDAITEMFNEYKRIYNDDSIGASEQTTEFQYWIDKQKYTKQQREIINDSFRYGRYSSVDPNESNYSKLVAQGVSPEDAKRIVENTTASDGEGVKQQDKVNAILKQNMSDDKTYAALGAVLNESTYDALTEARCVGISCRVFLDFQSKAEKMEADKDPDDPEKTIAGSKKEKVVELIDSLQLTTEQKDVLYLMYYAESGLDDTPWH